MIVVPDRDSFQWSVYVKALPEQVDSVMPAAKTISEFLFFYQPGDAAGKRLAGSSP
jgi:hypothetical protein